jgi:hypothetical protein
VIVTNHKEPSNEDDNYFERNYNPKMSQIIPTKKLYHEWSGKPSLIGNVYKPPSSGQVVPINNNGGGLFDNGSDGPLGGGGSGPLGGGSSGPLRDQNPKPYVAKLARLWIGPTQNLWYLSWYPIQPPITLNPPPSRKSLPYPIYTLGTYPNVHVRVFAKPFKPMEKKMLLISSICLFYTSRCHIWMGKEFLKIPSSLQIWRAKSYIM